jgi:hypothetical protein
VSTRAWVTRKLGEAVRMSVPDNEERYACYVRSESLPMACVLFRIGPMPTPELRRRFLSETGGF